MREADYSLLELELKKYITNQEHLDTIKDAFMYAKRMHEGQMRKSGDPYIVHPLDVAITLSEYQTDPTTIIAGLLHDTIEDTDATYEDIKDLFGDEVALITEGVTKLKQYKFQGLDLKADRK